MKNLLQSIDIPDEYCHGMLRWIDKEQLFEYLDLLHKESYIAASNLISKEQKPKHIDKVVIQNKHRRVSKLTERVFLCAVRDSFLLGEGILHYVNHGQDLSELIDDIDYIEFE